jgi:hypothetical protein
MNMGFLEAQRLFNPNCYIFHDVDKIAEDDRNLYRCEAMPLHLTAHMDKHRYK